MRRATTPTAWVSTVLAKLTNRFMILAFLVVLQTQLVSSVSAEVTFLNTWGSKGSGDGEFDNPWDIALSDTGQVYVTDRYNHRIQRFDADGNYQLQWGSTGTGDGEFYWPYGITLSDAGTLLDHDCWFNGFMVEAEPDVALILYFCPGRRSDESSCPRMQRVRITKDGTVPEQIVADRTQ